MLPPRKHFSITLMVILTCAWNPWLWFVLFSFLEETWIDGPEMGIPRWSHACATIADLETNAVKVVVAGGEDHAVNQLKSVEVFNTVTETWIMGPELPMSKVIAFSFCLLHMWHDLLVQLWEQCNWSWSMDASFCSWEEQRSFKRITKYTIWSAWTSVAIGLKWRQECESLGRILLQFHCHLVSLLVLMPTCTNNSHLKDSGQTATFFEREYTQWMKWMGMRVLWMIWSVLLVF